MKKEKNILSADHKPIEVIGARVNNLKNISLSIDTNKLVVITGLSGSGKSSLAFDTLFAEGQRRYVESLSAYARQFLGRINKPDVDNIVGISPAIAIEQKVSSRNPRSTVGTTTEIYDYLKLLYARTGDTFSPVSGRKVESSSPSAVTDFILSLPEKSAVVITSPVPVTDKSTLIEKLLDLMQHGFERLFLNGEIRPVTSFLPTVDSFEGRELEIVIDRVAPDKKQENVTRIADSVSQALELSGGAVRVNVPRPDGTCRTESFSTRFEADGITFEHPSEMMFSFNNPLGACPRCEGYGKIVGIDEDLVVPDRSKSVYDGAVVCWRGDTMKWWKEQLVDKAAESGFPIHRPYRELTHQQKKDLWQGTAHFMGIDQFFEWLEKERYKIQYRVLIARYTGKRTCPVCNGSRLRKEASYVKIGGRTISELVSLPVEELYAFTSGIELPEEKVQIARRILTEINNRLRYLMEVGLGYLTLDRLSSTLSGGESQRINLATSLGSSLVGSMYILDEPSIGLHPRDTARLVAVLKQLRDIGNTVIVVEHERDIMLAADQIIDIGPEAGVNGGEVVFQGTQQELKKAKNSLTADYLLGRRRIDPPAKYRRWKHAIELKGAREHNLKNIDVKFPLGVITCVTGVSGSGKSSLVRDVLHPALHRHFMGSGEACNNFDSLEGDLKRLGGVEMIDQNPIGRSSRSNPVTYIKAYDDIRKLFASVKFAKNMGFTPSSFSFNIAGGRCEECQGEGVIRVEMQFMADIVMTCEACNGQRFKDDILQVKYRGKSINDVLNMSVDEAVAFFGEDTKDSTSQRVAEKLRVLQDVGLGYVKLGQSSSTLSGGESQRVKLAYFLLKENTSAPLLFIFDEPTTGLHFHDISKLLKSINSLVDKGHTAIIVEHNLDVIKSGDWVIDLGPEGGEAGGYKVFEGTPAELAECTEGYTGQFLKKNEASSLVKNK